MLLLKSAVPQANLVHPDSKRQSILSGLAGTASKMERGLNLFPRLKCLSTATDSSFPQCSERPYYIAKAFDCQDTSRAFPHIERQAAKFNERGVDEGIFIKAELGHGR